MKFSEYVGKCVAELGDIPDVDCALKTGNASVIAMLQRTGEKDFNDLSATAQDCVTGTDVFEFETPKCIVGQTEGRIPSPSGAKTLWVYACRSSNDAQIASGNIDQMGLIGYNPDTGATCFFNSALKDNPGTFFESPQKSLSKGLPDPQTSFVTSAERKAAYKAWENDSAKAFGAHPIWATPVNMFGNDLDCVRCHNAYPFIHTGNMNSRKIRASAKGEKFPYLEKTQWPTPSNYTRVHRNGESPYKIVALDRLSTFFGKDMPRTDWQPRTLKHPDVALCTNCHRLGASAKSRDLAVKAVEICAESSPRCATPGGTYHDVLLGTPLSKFPAEKISAAIQYLKTCDRTPEGCTSEPVEGNDLPVR